MDSTRLPTYYHQTVLTVIHTKSPPGRPAPSEGPVSARTSLPFGKVAGDPIPKRVRKIRLMRQINLPCASHERVCFHRIGYALCLPFETLLGFERRSKWPPSAKRAASKAVLLNLRWQSNLLTAVATVVCYRRNRRSTGCRRLPDMASGTRCFRLIRSKTRQLAVAGLR